MYGQYSNRHFGSTRSFREIILNTLILVSFSSFISRVSFVQSDVVARSSKPFEPYRLECPRKFAAARLTLHKVRGLGGIRDDTLIVGLCNNFTQQYPSLRDAPGNDHDEVCRWTDAKPLTESFSFAQTCSSDKEYVAGISRRDVSMYGFLCCQLMDRKRRKCYAKRYNYPLTDDEPEITIERKDAIMTSFAYDIQNSLILEELRTEFSDNHVTQFSFPGKVQTTPKAILIGEAEARRLKAAALEKPQVAKLVLLRETDESNHEMSLRQRGWRQFNNAPSAPKKTVHFDKQLLLKQTAGTPKPKVVIPKVKILRRNFGRNKSGEELSEDVKSLLAQINESSSKSQEGSVENSQEEEIDTTIDGRLTPTTSDPVSPSNKKIKVVIIRKRLKYTSTSRAPNDSSDTSEDSSKGLVRLAQERSTKKFVVKKVLVSTTASTKPPVSSEELASTKSKSTETTVDQQGTSAETTFSGFSPTASTKVTSPHIICSVDNAAKDRTSGLVIACGQSGIVWRPARCPDSTVCSNTKDTSFMICCR